ncbi:MAG TPA: methyltransferase domain-containing protein [Rhodocyclaceae bacterium]|nr:methyltransferase domain-containing protein [Rhodocyclaceae bacterium]
MSALALPQSEFGKEAFDQAASTYDEAAVLAREVQARLAERLDYVKLNPQRVADIGCATGGGARELQRRYPEAQTLAIDYAHEMLRVVQASGHSRSWLDKIIKRNHSPQPLQADASALPLPHTALQLIWSNLVFHWLQDTAPVWKEFARVLETGGLLTFSMLGPDTARELREAGTAIGINVPVRRFYDMHDIGDQLVGAGFGDPVMDVEYITFTYRSARTFLADQRHLGVRNALLGQLGFSDWRRVLRQWETMRDGIGLPLTFEIIYGSAWRAEPKRTDDGRSIVQFHKHRP